jgi:hypothetical protein
VFDTLTFAVIDVDNGVLVLQCLDQATDESLGALWCGIDSDEVEGTLGSRHFDKPEVLTREIRGR